MNRLSMLALFAFLATMVLSVVAGDKIEVEDPDVIVGSADTFSDLIEENEVVLAEFYQHWCGHCKRLAPEFATAATTLKGKATLVKVDCGEEEDLCSKYGVRGYPSLKMFTGGVESEYKGGRTADEIASYVTKFSGPAFTTHESAEEVKELIKETETPLVFFQGTEKDQKKFEKLAKKMRSDFTFAIVSGEAAEEVSFADDASLVLVKADEENLSYTGKFKVSKITKFLEQNELPVLGELGPSNYSKYRGVGKPLVYVFVDPADEDTKAFKALVAPIAKELKDDLVMAAVDGKQYKSQAERLGLVCDDLPCIAIQDSNDAHFAYDEDADQTAEALTTWFKSYIAGDIEATIKSEEVPATQEALFKLVGSEFEQVAYGEKDVLVAFTAPWCGHCKSLKPKLAEVAELLEDVEDVVIANFDATANDAPTSEASVSGFPTIRFYKAGSKEAITFSGDRDTEGILAFLKENAASDNLDDIEA